MLEEQVLPLSISIQFYISYQLKLNSSFEISCRLQCCVRFIFLVCLLVFFPRKNLILTCRDVEFWYYQRTSYLSSFIMYQTSSLFSVKLMTNCRKKNRVQFTVTATEGFWRERRKQYCDCVVFQRWLAEKSYAAFSSNQISIFFARVFPRLAAAACRFYD